MKILFISRWFPYPPNNGTRIRVFNLIKHLSLHHEIDLVSFASETLDTEHLSTMHNYCQRVDVIPYRPFQPRRAKALLGFFSPRPRSVVDTHNPDMQKLVEKIGHESSADMVIASTIDMVPYALTLTNTTKIFEEIELTTLYEKFTNEHHPLKRFRNGLRWWKLSRYVDSLLSTFEACTVVSEGERERVRQISPNYTPIEIIPNGVDVDHYRVNSNPPQIDTLVYSGALTYNANFDAVNFFLRAILPLIHLERPDVKLRITGTLDGVPVDQLPDNKGVIFTGYVDDIRPVILQSWINIVPLRFGGGTRLKILESLALGTPVVTTSKGMEGLDLIPGRDLLVADTPEDFAATVLCLLQDSKQRESLSRNGRQAISAKYDWQIIGPHFNDFVEQVAKNTLRP